MSEHPTNQPIKSITVSEFEGSVEHYQVGHLGVTKIEPFTKSGAYASIPYLRVWRGDFVYAEFCQHNIHGVYFEAAIAAIAAIASIEEKLDV